MKPSRKLLEGALVALLSLSPLGCTGGGDSIPASSEPSGDVAAPLSSDTATLQGDEAVAALSPERKSLYDALASASRKPLRLVVDQSTGAVLSLLGEIPTSGADAKARAQGLVDGYQKLFDDRVSAKELRYQGNVLPCADAVAIFDRFVGGVQVVGSRLTLHFDGAGNVIAITNGVAPVPATIVTIDPLKAPGASDLLKLLPKNLKLGMEKRQKVLVPAYDGSGLHEAELASWRDDAHTGGVNAAVVVGNVALTGALNVAGDGAVVPPAGGAPKFRTSAATGLPSFVSYRDLGGVRINGLPAERNPLESAYRFLEEHPTLLRTGAARCQFAPLSIQEDASAPGAWFVHLTQRYGTLPVYGSEAVVQLEALTQVQSLSGRTLPRINLSPTPGITEAQAIDAQKAMLTAGASADPGSSAAVSDALARPATARLVVFPRFLSRDLQQKQDRLAYEVTRGSFLTLVDAQSKAILYGVSGRQGISAVREAGGGSEFNFPFYQLLDRDGVRVGSVAPSSDNVFGRAGGTVSTSINTLRNFYLALGWNGQNGFGSDFVVGTNVAMSSGCANAMFDSLITQSAFFCDGVAANDIVGHELTHGVIAHSSGLIYQDESGAINEAYADLMGNLIFPDPTGGWFVGDQMTARGPFRDMANPSFNSQPGHYSAYVARDSTCDLLPTSCDNGFVHTNSGIINLAHQLLADGFTRAGVTVPGITRNKLARLAFVTMTRRLPGNALMNDVAVATRDVCDLFVARGVRDITNTVPFTATDCNAVDAAFNEVGLGGGLSTGWTEPQLGFEGTQTFNGPTDTTPGLCPVLNVAGALGTLSGDLPFDLDPATGTPVSASWFAGAFGVNYVVAPGTPPPPIGTPLTMHTVHWWDVFGYRPSFRSAAIPNTLSCPPLTTDSQSSPDTFARDDFFGASGTGTAIGPTASTVSSSCVLTRTDVELWSNDLTTRLAGPGSSVQSTVTHWIFFVPVNFVQRASLAAVPVGGANLQGRVNWSFDMGRSIRVKLRYTWNHPSGVSCIP